MLSVGIAVTTVVVALVTIFVTHWVHKWRNPKCRNGVLPPGSMGFPLIGETIQLLIPNRSLELHPFISKRVQRYGSVFRTNVAGKQVVITIDPKFNHYIITEEGKFGELWYLDTFSSILPTYAVGSAQKYIRSIILTHFGVDGIRVNLLPQVEQLIQKTLRNWSTKPIVDDKHDVTCMIFDFTLKQLCGYDWEKSLEMRHSEKFSSLLHGLLSLPLDIPGTTFHKCVKAENEVIVKNRENLDSPLSWEEYKSMTFTPNVVNEVLRLANVAPGLLRKVTKDIKFNGP